jgi:hypothetical protein
MSIWLKAGTVAVAGASLFAAACTQAQGVSVPAPAAQLQAELAPMATLTEVERQAGWTLLFNGRDFTGWRVYRGGAPKAPWIVEDGAMALTARGGGDLVTEEEFGPFELSLEWKISPNGNSGIMYLVKESEAAANTYNTGPEMQVLDDSGHPDGRIPSHRAGALYDFAEPFVAAAKPVGEWNEARIRFTGSAIEHWLNGQKVAESSYGDDAWRAKVATTKFKTMPLFGLASTGRIALQDHGDKVWYRNIKIRRL